MGSCEENAFMAELRNSSGSHRSNALYQSLTLVGPLRRREKKA
jgi:hypothetical protein